MAQNADYSLHLTDREPNKTEGKSAGMQEVIAVAPLRIDLTGGFTDIPPFCSSVESLHINAASSLTVKVRCRNQMDGQIRIHFVGEEYDQPPQISEGRRRFVHAVRLAVAEFASGYGLELSVTSDAPAGSGLGSSGAILVAAVAGCAKLAGAEMTPTAAAEKAIEAASAAGILGGRQDEFAAANGSLRAYLFSPNGASRIFDIDSPRARKELENNLIIVQTSPVGRRVDIVAEVAQAVRDGDRRTVKALHLLQNLAHELFSALTQADFERLPKLLMRIREAQFALHGGVRCPIAAAAMDAVREQIPELEYKVLGGGGTGSCVLAHIPAPRKIIASALIRRYAKRVFPVRVRTSGVTAKMVPILTTNTRTTRSAC